MYAAEGTYPELLIVTNGVGVYGGYDASWQRGLSNETRITGYTLSDGSTEGAGHSRSRIRRPSSC